MASFEKGRDIMKKERLFDRYILAKPTARMLIEWPVLIGIGVTGTIFKLKTIPLFPVSNIVGFMLLGFGIIVHRLSHKVHKQAHQHSEKVEKLATGGIYSRIRHPGYLGLILMYLGFALAWGIVWLLVPVVIFIMLTVLTAIREEAALKERFGKDYEEYIKLVPSRFIPGVF
jgi:protein-S-isoprenylcysteine O-methyltransferase Ste14